MTSNVVLTDSSTKSAVWRPFLSAGLAVVGLGVATAAVLNHHIIKLTYTGSLFALPPFWYVGIALIVVGLLCARLRNGWEMTVGAVSLVLGLSTWVAIVFNEPRYNYAAKQIGVVNFFRLQPAVPHPTSDISVAWPGVFSAMMWVTHATHIDNPLVLARWWPVFFAVVSLLLVRLLAGRVVESTTRCWLAGIFFALAGTAIGQDYFSPQAAALLLTLFILVLTVRPEIFGPQWFRWTLLISSILAVAVTHQVTPYMLAIFLAILCAFRLVKEWWVPIFLVAVSAAWALYQYQSWIHDLKPSQVGAVASNTSLGSSSGPLPNYPIILWAGLAVLAGVLIIAALAGISLIFDYRRYRIALALCATAPVILLVFTAYGGEGLNRVMLFSLPWLSVLAAGFQVPNQMISKVVPIAVLPLLVVASFVARASVDDVNVYTPVSVAAEQGLENNIPRNSVIATPYGAFPVKVTGNYFKFRFRSRSIPNPAAQFHGGKPLTANGVNYWMTRYLVQKNSGLSFYWNWNPATLNFAVVYGHLRPDQIPLYERGFKTSGYWTSVFDKDGVHVYRLKIPAIYKLRAEFRRAGVATAGP